ncbi:uncharacterized protein LOC119406592 [Rhipicephalus sanguineus]|uniref:uncharacterized protein LOC119406592 n=1 Tax=Rhipicephalus sanguineus TaxID=34632 RepID=UPI0018945A76|nr:uncharacterized protein LOC119406592 [Rhipicephalus sanguineus]
MLVPSSADLHELIDELRDKVSALAELDKQIAYALDGEEFGEEITGAIEYHEKIVKAVSRLRSALNACASVGPTVIEANQPRHADTIDGSSSSMEAAHSDTIGQRIVGNSRPRAPGFRVALPKLQVPTFSSENCELPGFWEHCEATIHTHPKLTDIETFKCLKPNLAGSTRRATKGTRLTEKNYNVAVKVSTEGYVRKALVDDHTDSLLAIEPIESSSQVSRLPDVHDKIEFRTSCLVSLGTPFAENAAVPHRVLLRSLPEDLAILYRNLEKTKALERERRDARALKPWSSPGSQRRDAPKTRYQIVM